MKQSKLCSYFLALIAIFAIFSLALFMQDVKAEGMGLMYQAEKNNTKIYLYGTIHIGAEDFYPLSNSVHSAIEKSQVLAVEIDLLSPELGRAMNTYGLMPDGHDLSEVVGNLQARKAATILQQFKIPHNYALRLKPGLAALSIGGLSAQGTLYSSQNSVDSYLLGFARAKQKNIVEIEGAKKQFQMFDKVDIETQKKILNSSISDAENGVIAKEGEALVAAWKSGNESGLEKIVIASVSDPDFGGTIKEILFTSRNNEMKDFIEKLSKEKTTAFVAVGVLHLVGEFGLVQLLKKAGFQVDRTPIMNRKTTLN